MQDSTARFTLTIEPLSEGGYVATSKEVQGLVAQGASIEDVISYARDIAKKLLDARTATYRSPRMPQQQKIVVSV